MIPRRIIFHHSADASTTPQFARVDAYHKTRGFPKSRDGYWCGYHYFIERDGTIQKARHEDEIGAHDTGENLNSIGICLAGHFNVESPTEAQAARIAWLVEDIRSRWDIPITRIEPHRWDDDTQCPGTNVPDGWLTEQYLTRAKNPIFKTLYLILRHFKLI